MLVVRHGPNAGSSYRLEKQSTAIGRHPDSDIFLDDITVSRRHVVVDHEGDGYTLRDVGSLNGTYVNRNRVVEASLHYGDEEQIGRDSLSFVIGGDRGERDA
jgi:pSer/pThr/pTyr-binding forkhead associated (FHA) protein